MLDGLGGRLQVQRLVRTSWLDYNQERSPLFDHLAHGERIQDRRHGCLEDGVNHLPNLGRQTSLRTDSRRQPGRVAPDTTPTLCFQARINSITGAQFSSQSPDLAEIDGGWLPPCHHAGFVRGR